MVKVFLLAFTLFSSKIPTLVDCTLQDWPLPGKRAVLLQTTWSEPLPDPYFVSLQASFNTPSGIQSMGFVRIYNVGTIGPDSSTFKVPLDWSLIDYTLIEYGEYIP